MIKDLYRRNLTLTISFLAFLFLSTNLLAQDAKPFVGTWNGSISAAGQVFEITVEFSLDDNQQIMGNIDFPSQGANDLNLINISIEEKKISFGIEGAPGEPTLAGELDATNTKIEGKFTQSGYEGTFNLEKVSK